MEPAENYADGGTSSRAPPGHGSDGHWIEVAFLRPDAGPAGSETGATTSAAVCTCCLFPKLSLLSCYSKALRNIIQCNLISTKLMKINKISIYVHIKLYIKFMSRMN